ncbi:hypothetical protein HXX76_008440 [Chlamydomonas incerta]|uniref:Uncharacterized protein n=1 Tax=Chlamydomonas incerta TaxID=51695 RepID=A0A835W1A6_CHLIN|nr:hypothetical protein HXX76_008440 [Chlamydomonas incerta]|eukprot:KAG2433379.1 hypothetical protein HXX76_008440 [Chlamydomonas incerta]
MSLASRSVMALSIEVPDFLKDESLSDLASPPSLPPSADAQADTPQAWDEPFSPGAMSALASPWGVGPFEGASASASADSLSPFACARPNAFAACGRISTSSSGAGTHYECLAYSPHQVSSSGGSSQYTNTLYNSGSDDEEEDEPSSPAAAPANAPWCCTTRLVSLSSCASAFASACPSPRAVPSSPQKQPCTPASTTICRDTPATPATITSSSADQGCCCLSPRTEARVAAAFGRFDWAAWASEPEWSALRDAQMSTLEHFGLIHWTLSDLHDAQLAEAFASVDWAALAATCASAACASATSAATAIAAATTTSSCEVEVEAQCEDFGLLREAADEVVLALLSPAHQRGYRLAAADVVLMCADMADLEACGLVGWTPKRLALDTAFRRLVLEAPAAEAAEAAEAAGAAEAQGSGGDSCCGSPCCTSAGGSSYSPCSTSSSTRGSCGAWWLADEADEAVRALVFGEETCC